MEKYKCDFIEFLFRCKALQIGTFTLKSGRVSPYFFNAGVFCDGEKSLELGRAFAAKAYQELGENFDLFFGPAYKGIPLAVATSIAYFEQYNKEKGWVFNRKEVKDHGDKGAYVGSQIVDGSRIVLLDDVFTTGGTKEEAIRQIKSVAKVDIAGVFIAVDRNEKNDEGLNAITEFEKAFGVKVHSIVNVHEIFEFLHNRAIEDKIAVSDEDYKKYQEYRAQYCLD